MTPLLSRSTRALAQQCNAATARVSALQRESLVEVRRTRAGMDAAKCVLNSDCDVKVFEEHIGENDLGDGHGDDGVGR